MQEDRQITVVIGAGLLLCVLILGYSAFFSSPIKLYTVKVENKAIGEEFVSDNDEIYDFEESLSDLVSNGPINLNTATALELTRLDGVGEVTAERIIAYREENGGFTMVEELLDINGIGEKKFSAIEPYVTVD